MNSSARCFVLSERFPEITVAQCNTGPSEGMLFNARDVLVAAGGDLRKLKDIEAGEYTKKLGDEEAQPELTIESFVHRVRAASRLPMMA